MWLKCVRHLKNAIFTQNFAMSATPDIYIHIQSCQPLRFGCSLLRPRAQHYAHDHITTLSLRKTFFFKFSIPWVRVGIKFASNQLCVCLFVSEMLVVPQPIGVRVLTSWPIIAFGSIPAFMRHFLARQLPFSIISNHHAETRSWKQTPGWRISPKKRTPTFPGRVLYRTVSVRCTINAEPTSSVLGTFLSPMLECTTSNNASAWSVTSTKEKR